MKGTGKKYRAIVIGASAGGLSALSVILGDLPAAYAVPVIVVQHRAKDQKNLLEEVLQSRCRIPVKQADEKEKIAPGKVYIAPPDYHLLIESDCTFSLNADDYVQYSRPSIDVLFESAAQVYAQELAAIILTGANRDGAKGLMAVKRRGGLTIAQAPADAEYPAMPKAAIDEGAAALVMGCGEIKDFLLSSVI
jgi:two-component system chemotaxis response regulator CheB